MRPCIEKTISSLGFVCLVWLLLWMSTSHSPSTTSSSSSTGEDTNDSDTGGGLHCSCSLSTPSVAVPYICSDKCPGQVLDLTNWQLNLPTNANGTGGSTTVSLTITQRSFPTPLSRYSLSPWFQTLTVMDDQGGTNNNKDGERRFDVVAMRANADGAKTSNNTKFARCEFREMKSSTNADGSIISTALASWSFTDGKTHQMTIDQAVVRLSAKRPRTVAGQIHDYKNDVFMLSIDGESEGSSSSISTKRRASISAKFDNSAVTRVLIGSNGYTLGDFFTLTVTVNSSSSISSTNNTTNDHDDAEFNVTIDVLYNGVTHSVNWSSFPNIAKYNPRFESMYFKAGNYIQSNVVDYHELPDDFTEVWIKRLNTTHS